MKAVVKKILPNRFIQLFRRIKQRIDISKSYKFDKNRLKKFAYSLNKNYSEDNLRSKITFHYHAIEKGLSNSNLRLGFGERAFNELFWALDEYVTKGYRTDDFRFQSALSVINSYIKLHESKKFSVNWIEEQMMKYSKYLIQENKEIGGYKTINSNELPQFNKLGFKDLARNRYSVRDFGKDILDDNKIFEAIDIATKSPSACNRQPWRIRYIKSLDIIQNMLKIQSGLTGNGENLNKLLLITAEKQYMNGGHERNQTYIDGGIFTMSLLYALTSLNIASCTLNASFDLKRERDMRQLLNVNDSEDFIAIIAIGSYPKVFKVAKSPRDNHSLITSVIE